MMQRVDKTQFIVLILLLGLMIITAVFIAPYVPPLRDFDQTFYPAIKYTINDTDPYTAEYFGTEQGASPDFFSPPWVLLLLTPLGLFSLEIARALWMVFLVGVIFIAIILLRNWGLQSRWLFLLLAFPWVLITILYGQVTAFVLLGTVIAVPEVNKSTRAHKSALLLLLSFLLLGTKPQLGLFIFIPLFLQMIWQRDKRLGLILLGGFIVVVLSVLVTPSPLWLLKKSGDVRQIAPHWVSTLERELKFLNYPLWIAAFVRLFVCFVMGVWGWRIQAMSPTWWAAWLAVVLVVTPYSRAYDGVLLLPLFAQFIVWQKFRLFLFVVGMVGYVILMEGEMGTVLAPLLAWVLFVPWAQIWLGSITNAPYNYLWENRVKRITTSAHLV